MLDDSDWLAVCACDMLPDCEVVDDCVGSTDIDCEAVTDWDSLGVCALLDDCDWLPPFVPDALCVRDAVEVDD
jgi:hypothetical protein